MADLPERPTTALQVLELLEPLNVRAKELKRRENEQRGTPWETRHRMANGIEAAVGLTQVHMNVLHHARSGHFFGRSADAPAKVIPLDFPQVAGLAPETDMTFAQESYEVFARMGLLLQVQFQVERMMEDLLRALGRPAKGLERNARDLLQHARVSAPVRKASWVYLPLLMRNTQHNGGFHGRPNRQITVGHTKYVFRKDRRFEQAGWHHIAHALSAELDVLDELLASPTLEQLGLVPDRFAFLLDNGYLPLRDVYVN
jgi:hypothetical protein